MGNIWTKLINEEREDAATGPWPLLTARGQTTVSAINRGAWVHSKPSLGKPLSLTFATTPPPLQHHHPPPSSIVHLECVVVSGSKIDSKDFC